MNPLSTYLVLFKSKINLKNPLLIIIQTMKTILRNIFLNGLQIDEVKLKVDFLFISNLCTWKIELIILLSQQP